MSGDKYNKRRKKILEELDCGNDLSIMELGMYDLTPYFRTDEIDENDMRAYTNMDAYVTMPGVVYSDTAIVQSEGIRKLYIKKLTDFFGEKSEAEWENKIEAEDIGGI